MTYRAVVSHPLKKSPCLGSIVNKKPVARSGKNLDLPSVTSGVAVGVDEGPFLSVPATLEGADVPSDLIEELHEVDRVGGRA